MKKFISFNTVRTTHKTVPYLLEAIYLRLRKTELHSYSSQVWGV